MEKLRNLTMNKRSLLIASGIVCASAGAYAIYKVFFSNRRTGLTQACSRQPSENVDHSDYDEKQISASGKRVLVLGLEKSGKSCLLAALSSEEEPKEYQPTLGFNVVCIGTNVGPRLDIMEVGGSDKYKGYWGSFVKDINILMYVIDSGNEESLPDSLDSLNTILQMKELENIPVVIVFSKRDIEDALSLEHMVNHFENERFENRNFQYSSIQVRSGGAPITEGIDELQETIQNLQ